MPPPTIAVPTRSSARYCAIRTPVGAEACLALCGVDRLARRGCRRCLREGPDVVLVVEGPGRDRAARRQQVTPAVRLAERVRGLAADLLGRAGSDRVLAVQPADHGDHVAAADLGQPGAALVGARP